jgi:hypothetical protein
MLAALIAGWLSTTQKGENLNYIAAEA